MSAARVIKAETGSGLGGSSSGVASLTGATRAAWFALTSIVAALVLAVGCGNKAAAIRPVFQGVVEQDERVFAFELSGRVRSVDVARGDAVDQGRVLATLDDGFANLAQRARRDDEAVVRAELALLEAGARPEDAASLAAEVRAARAQEELAHKTKSRVQSLHLSSSVGQADLDRADTEFARTVSQRESLEQRLQAVRNGPRTEEIARARARLEAAASAVELEHERVVRHTLRAIGAGKVLDVSIKPGEFAMAGAPAVTIAEVTRPYTDVFVPQGALAGVRVGVKAEVRVDAAATTLRGTVEHVFPKTEFTPRYLFSEQERPLLVVRVRVRIDDPRELLTAGVPAFVSFDR